MQIKNIFLFGIILFFHFEVFSQNENLYAQTNEIKLLANQEIQDTAPSKKKFEDFSFDISVGLGFSQYGIAGDIGFSFDIKHILCVLKRYNPTFVAFDQEVNVESILFGYRIRNRKQIISLAAGFGTATYRCTSGLTYDCYNYVEEKISVYPILMEVDFHVKKNHAFGVEINFVLNKRESNFGMLFVMKFGLPGGFVK